MRLLTKIDMKLYKVIFFIGLLGIAINFDHILLEMFSFLSDKN